MNKDVNPTIKFYAGDEKGVVIERGNYDESIFRDQYDKARFILRELEEVEPLQSDNPGNSLMSRRCNHSLRERWRM